MTIVRKSIEAIVEAIGQVAATGAAFQVLVHETAVQTLLLVREEGDWGPARDLMNAMPKGARREALAIWFKRFSNDKLRFSTVKETGLYKGHLSSDRALSDFDVDGAAAVNFADLTTEPKASTFTLEQLIKTLQAKATNTKVNDDGTPKVDERARAMASKLLAAIYGGGIPAPVAAPTVQ
jgi:hypothetical protein